MRFFIAMFSHETNTFSTIPTDQRQFEARDLRYGGEILEAYRGTGTCLGGMIDAAVGEAVARARDADGHPVILADIADNTGGGAGGDTTEILRELLRVGARHTTVASIWDAEAVQACVKAGVGATVTVRVGGKVDPSHGAPLEVTGRVRMLSDGRFVHKGPMFRGLEGRLGRTAEKILVLKSSVHYRAAFEPLAHTIIEVDAPGLSSSNLGRFTFKHVRRPIYPLDEL